MSDTPGKFLSLLHLGYSVKDRAKTLEFFCEKLGSASCALQRNDAPYFGDVNGCKGAIGDLAFIGYGEDRPIVEILDFEYPEDIHRAYKPGEDSFAAIGFRTGDIDACYARLKEAGVNLAGEPAVSDYGYAKGKKAFYAIDPDDMYVQIVEADEKKEGDGSILDHDHAVMSVADLDEAVPLFRDLLDFDVEIVDTADSATLNDLCVKAVGRVAVCRYRNTEYTLEIWETGSVGGIEDIHISASGSVHLCFTCQGIDNLYDDMHEQLDFVDRPVTITKGANKDSKAIFFHAPGYLWIEILCRKANL